MDTGTVILTILLVFAVVGMILVILIRLGKNGFLKEFASDLQSYDSVSGTIFTKLLAITGILATLLAFIFYFEDQAKQHPSFSTTTTPGQDYTAEVVGILFNAVDKLDERLSELDSTINLISDTSKVDSAGTSQVLTSLSNRMNGLRREVDSLKELNLAMRQAINPIHPEEVLTIARLTDQLTILSNNTASQRQEIALQQEKFEKSVIREIDSSSRATNTVLILLVPLMLNFFYSVYKDFRGHSSAAKSNTDTTA